MASDAAAAVDGDSSYESSVIVRDGSIDICMQGRALDDKGAERWCAWARDYVPGFLRKNGLQRRTDGFIAAREVNFSSNALGDYGVLVVLRVLYGLRIGIRVLKLYKNNLGRAAASALMDWLVVTPVAVLELHLSHNFIPREGAVDILKAVAHNMAYPPDKPGRGKVPLWLRLEQNIVEKPDDLITVAENQMKKIRARGEGASITGPMLHYQRDGTSGCRSDVCALTSPDGHCPLAQVMYLANQRATGVKVPDEAKAWQSTREQREEASRWRMSAAAPRPGVPGIATSVAAQVQRSSPGASAGTAWGAIERSSTALADTVDAPEVPDLAEDVPSNSSSDEQEEGLAESSKAPPVAKAAVDAKPGKAPPPSTSAMQGLDDQPVPASGKASEAKAPPPGFEPPPKAKASPLIPPLASAAKAPSEFKAEASTLGPPSGPSVGSSKAVAEFKAPPVGFAEVKAPQAKPPAKSPPATVLVGGSGLNLSDSASAAVSGVLSRAMREAPIQKAQASPKAVGASQLDAKPPPTGFGGSKGSVAKVLPNAKDRPTVGKASSFETVAPAKGPPAVAREDTASRPHRSQSPREEEAKAMVEDGGGGSSPVGDRSQGWKPQILKRPPPPLPATEAGVASAALGEVEAPEACNDVVPPHSGVGTARQQGASGDERNLELRNMKPEEQEAIVKEVLGLIKGSADADSPGQARDHVAAELPPPPGGFNNFSTPVPGLVAHHWGNEGGQDVMRGNGVPGLMASWQQRSAGTSSSTIGRTPARPKTMLNAAAPEWKPPEHLAAQVAAAAEGKAAKAPTKASAGTAAPAAAASAPAAALGGLINVAAGPSLHVGHVLPGSLFATRPGGQFLDFQAPKPGWDFEDGTRQASDVSAASGASALDPELDAAAPLADGRQASRSFMAPGAVRAVGSTALGTPIAPAARLNEEENGEIGSTAEEGEPGVLEDGDDEDQVFMPSHQPGQSGDAGSDNDEGSRSEAAPSRPRPVASELQAVSANAERVGRPPVPPIPPPPEEEITYWRQELPPEEKHPSLGSNGHGIVAVATLPEACAGVGAEPASTSSSSSRSSPYRPNCFDDGGEEPKGQRPIASELQAVSAQVNRVGRQPPPQIPPPTAPNSAPPGLDGSLEQLDDLTAVGEEDCELDIEQDLPPEVLKEEIRRLRRLIRSMRDQLSRPEAMQSRQVY